MMWLFGTLWKGLVDVRGTTVLIGLLACADGMWLLSETWSRAFVLEASAGLVLLILGLLACVAEWQHRMLQVACVVGILSLIGAVSQFGWRTPLETWPGVGLLMLVGLSVLLLLRFAFWAFTDHRARHRRAVGLEGDGKIRFARQRDARQNDRVTILHLSDLHFRPDFQIDDPRSECLDHLETALSHHAGEVDLVAVTGDLVDGELTMAEAVTVLPKVATYLERLCRDILRLDDPAALLIIPGNHDYRRKGLFANPEAIRLFRDRFRAYGAHTLFTFRNVGLHLLCACFDSNVGASLAELATGRVNIEELNRLDRQLCEINRDPAQVENATRLAEAFRLALVHHHILPVSDAEELVTARERRMGRKIMGAPEVMILKNAGIFLRRLQDLQFRLILHGHLHLRSYLQAVVYAGRQEEEKAARTVEIVAAGSACLPDQRERYTFNLVRVFRDHCIQVQPVEFSHGGQIVNEIPLPMTAPYGQVRLERYDQLPCPGRQPVRCDTFSSYWDIDLPEGDAVVTDVIRGLRSNTGEDVLSIDVAAEELTLTRTEFSARLARRGELLPDPRVELLPDGGGEADAEGATPPEPLARIMHTSH
jgi:3',5'-cyclic AMP phosphodiesterase CpdA